MAIDNRLAAKELSLAGRYRSAINRAYYAVYCVVASVLQGRVDFAYDGNNPAHDQLEPLILNMGTLSRSNRYDLRKIVRRLRAARVSSDYVPTDTIDNATALQAFRDVEQAFKILGARE